MTWITKSKLSFARRVIGHRLKGQPRVCPYCGPSSQLELLGRKKLIMDVLRCRHCLLIFRWPMDTPEDNSTYYQSEYEAGIATDQPSNGQLEEMMKGGFRGTTLDLSPKIQILRAIRPSGVVLDYGCSWGYGVHQLRTHGYEAVGFEVSKPRAAYGRSKLGVDIRDDPRDLDGFSPKRFDIIFTHHVLEHLPNIREVLDTFGRLLADDGLAFHALPNFTGRSARSGLFWRWIGEAHPLAPTKDFFERNLPSHGFRRVVCGSGPFDGKLEELIRRGQWEGLDVDGDELFVIARKS
jgi:2-polyprenyl-3-methyl-5-hydroxy-6-metoxy-1,4-benzoquinol methylase